MIRKSLVLLAFLYVSVTSFAQDDASVRFAATITAEELKEHVYYLAGPECEGRETGEHGQKVAALFLADYFKSLGIPPVTENYFQVFPIPGDDDCSSFISINGKALEPDVDYAAYCGFLKNNSVTLQELVFSGYGIQASRYSDYKSIDVKNKWVVVLDGEPGKNGNSLINPSERETEWTYSVKNKVEAAENNGAAGLIIITSGRIKNKYDYDNYIALEKKYNEYHIPYLYITADIADRFFFNHAGTSTKQVSEEIDNSKKTRHFSLSFNDLVIKLNQETEKKTGENVLAYIEGSDKKDELVIITAHYDHLGYYDGKMYYGADDDGSGTATIMELAEAFMEAKKNGFGPRRSVLIMPVSGEEKGLWGSEYYSDHPVFPLENTVADLNIDMIGRMDKYHKDPNYVYLIGSDKLSSDLHRISEEVNAKYMNIMLDYKYNDPKDPNQFYYRSDHYNFARYNIPVIFYFTGVHEDYHKPTDTADKLDYQKMEKIARLVFHTAWQLANQDEKIKVDKENSFKNRR